MRRRLKEKLPSKVDTSFHGDDERHGRDEERLLPDVVPAPRDDEQRNGTPRIKGANHAAPLRPSVPNFRAFSPSNSETRRVLDLRDKKKLRCIWLAPDEGDQIVVRPPPLDGEHYGSITMSRFGQDVITKMMRADALSVQLEKNARFMDAVHTYEQSSKMLNRCIQKRSEAQDVTPEEVKWLRVDYEIRCVQLVALCLLGARRSDAVVDNTPFLLLKKAEELTARDGLHYCKRLVQRVGVYQGMAGYYKKQKKLQAALQAAEKAIRINEKLPIRDRIPIAFFLTACLHGLLGDPSNAGLMYIECLNLSQAQQTSDASAIGESYHIHRAAALHNMAIEWANLHMPDQCREALASAMEIGVNQLPRSHPVVTRILETYKIMRQNFLFNDTADSPPRSSIHPVRPTPPSSPSPGPRPSPPPRASPKGPASNHGTRSPRVQNLQRQADAQTVSPVRPPPGEDSNGTKVSSSPRKPVPRRPLSTPEVPSGLAGRPLSPGATRLSHVTTIPEETFTRALSSRHNSHKHNVVSEARVFVARRKAAIRIQNVWRTSLARHRADQQRRQEACIQIQSIARMHMERCQYKEVLENAAKTQAVWRGAVVRSQIEQESVSGTKIQAIWRGKAERARYYQMKENAVYLQAVLRGFITRRVLAEQQESAVKIQSHIRRSICVKQYRASLDAIVEKRRLSEVAEVSAQQQTETETKIDSDTTEKGEKHTNQNIDTQSLGAEEIPLDQATDEDTSGTEIDFSSDIDLHMTQCVPPSDHTSDSAIIETGPVTHTLPATSESKHPEIKATVSGLVSSVEDASIAPPEEPVEEVSAVVVEAVDADVSSVVSGLVSSVEDASIAPPEEPVEEVSAVVVEAVDADVSSVVSGLVSSVEDASIAPPEEPVEEVSAVVVEAVDADVSSVVSGLVSSVEDASIAPPEEPVEEVSAVVVEAVDADVSSVVSGLVSSVEDASIAPPEEPVEEVSAVVVEAVDADVSSVVSGLVSSVEDASIAPPEEPVEEVSVAADVLVPVSDAWSELAFVEVDDSPAGARRHALEIEVDVSRPAWSSPSPKGERKMDNMRLKVAGRMASLNDAYFDELIGSCVGSLDDINDGLSEIFGALMADDERAVSNSFDSPDQTWAFPLTDTQDADQSEVTIAPSISHDDPIPDVAEATSNLDVNESNRVSVIERTTSNPVESGPQMRLPPTPAQAIGWNPLTQDRDRLVRNVVSLYVYSTMQYALLEAVNQREEQALEEQEGKERQ